MDGPIPTDEFRRALAQPPDPVVAGLERKLDVLRGQLAASQAGQDVGAAGLETWSRLEQQAQRIAALEAYITQQAEQAELLRQAGRTAAADVARCAKAQAALTETCDTLRQSSQMLQAALDRALADLAAERQTNAELSQAVLNMAAAPHMAPEREALLCAMLGSTSWRITRPLRLISNRLKRRRHQSL